MVARQRAEDKYDALTYVAWRTAHLQRLKTLPSLKSVLQKREARPQSVGQMKTTLHLFAETYGGSVRRGAGDGRRKRTKGTRGQ